MQEPAEPTVTHNPNAQPNQPSQRSTDRLLRTCTPGMCSEFARSHTQSRPRKRVRA
jgi:hypothetical protein